MQPELFEERREPTRYEAIPGTTLKHTHAHTAMLTLATLAYEHRKSGVTQLTEGETF